MIICEKCEKVIDDKMLQCPRCGGELFEQDIDEFVNRKFEHDISDIVAHLAFDYANNYGNLIYREDGSYGTELEVYEEALKGCCPDGKKASSYTLLYHRMTEVYVNGKDLLIISDELRKTHFKFTGLSHPEIIAFHILNQIRKKTKSQQH